ncbi:MAG: serine/threonine protein kinase [Tannerella sp.]|jgi:serine/threonine protein kinase|nr:serine/threonine protein kinase [Tannerella sp.]
MLLQEDILFDNRYLLKRLLGCGGFSEVWLVEDTKVGNKKMALKIFVPERGLDDNGVQLFSSEFELVFDLNHTNLMRPSHFNVCERSPYLLMPYSEQGSVNKLVGLIADDDAWRLLHDVASGLEYLHGQHPPIIHQDIKPDNILIDQSGHYQITDFGISTKTRSTLRKSVGEAKMSMTVAYSPPERFGQHNAAIPASDIWSLGATMFELLTGEMPFHDHGGLIQKHGAEIPLIHGDRSSDLIGIITMCLSVDIEQRPTAEQIVTWTNQHFKGAKIVFEQKKIATKQNLRQAATGDVPNPSKSSSKKMIGIVAGSVLLICLAITFVFVKPGQSDIVSTNEHIGIEIDSSEINPAADTISSEADYDASSTEIAPINQPSEERDNAVNQPPIEARSVLNQPLVETSTSTKISRLYEHDETLISESGEQFQVKAGDSFQGEMRQDKIIQGKIIDQTGKVKHLILPKKNN